MLPRQIKLYLWNSPGRATYLRCLDRLIAILARRSDAIDAELYPCPVPACDVAFSEGVLEDKKRNISIGYEVFRPRNMKGRLPLIVFSRGMHFSDDLPAPRSLYLAEHFAAHGYIVLHLRHDDSDAVFLNDVSGGNGRLLQQIRAVYTDWVNEPDRILDISFAIDTVEAWDKADSPIAGHVDLDRIGVSGYSFGVRSVLAAIGERIGPKRRSYKDGRIRAGVLYSAALGWPPGEARDVFCDVDVPLLHMTGTRDRAYADPLIPEDKLGAFEGIAAPNQYAVVLRRADHIMFSGERIGGEPVATDPRHHQLIKNVALAFWDAYLKGDVAARRWLDADFARVLGREGKFRRK